MGKLLEQYQAEYNEYKAAVRAGIVEKNEKTGYVVRPEVWITRKYFDDHNIHSGNDPKFSDFINDTLLTDIAFGEVIATGLEIIAKGMRDERLKRQ